MNRVSKVIITIVIVIVVVIVGWILIRAMDSTNKSTETSGGNQNQPTDSGSSQDVVQTITYNGTAFMPSTATVKVGDVIEVVNGSSNVMEFASDQHPTHLDNSEFNVGEIEPGNRTTFTVITAGTWGYHDHYNATANGELIVE